MLDLFFHAGFGIYASPDAVERVGTVAGRPLRAGHFRRVDCRRSPPRRALSLTAPDLPLSAGEAAGGRGAVRPRRASAESG